MMDTSETYIKMCDCPEIQDGWKPKVADFFSFLGDAHTMKDYEIDALNKRKTDVDYYDKVVSMIGGHFLDHWNECRDGFVWLPRQDQIQEMLWNKNGPVHPFRLFPRLVRWFDSGWDNMPEISGLNTPEQLWLAFYMSERHSKTWSMEKECWIEKK